VPKEQGDNREEMERKAARQADKALLALAYEVDPEGTHVVYVPERFEHEIKG
jgi:hypothetical protein